MRSVSLPVGPGPELAAVSETFPPADELTELSQEYDRLASYLFTDLSFGLIGGNPFEAALGRDAPPAQPPSSPPPPSKPDAKPPPPDSGEAAEGRRSADSIRGGPREKLFDFLVITEFGAGKQVYRAFRDESGDFLLEDSTRLNFFPGVTHQLLVFREGDQVVTCDENEDGLVDFLLTRVGSSGSEIDLFVQELSGRFVLTAQVFLPRLRVHSAAPLRITPGESPEIGVIAFGSNNLILLRRQERTYIYSREIPLPLRPSVLISRPVPPGQEARARVYDSTLSQYIDLLFRYGVAQFTSGGDGSLFRPLKLRIGGQDQHVLVWQDSRQIILAENVTGTAVLIGSIESQLGVPLVLLGDYQHRLTRQLVLLP